MKGFWVKVAGGLFYALLVHFYWRVGDTESYFAESLAFKNLIAEGKISYAQFFFYDYSYFTNAYDMHAGVTNSGFAVIKISLILCYFSLSRFLLSTMLMATITYAGIFKLFETFVSIIPSKHRVISLIVLFFPSVVIYGSGIFKDPICISALGWLFYSIYTMVKTKKISFINITIFFISCYFIVIIKAYILAAFMIPFCLYLIIISLKKIKSPVFRSLALPLLISGFVLMYFAFDNEIDNLLGAFAIEKISDNVQGLQKSYSNMSEEDAGSNFEIGTVEPTLGGVIKKMPVGIVATLFRPFLWEVRKPFILFSALESFVLSLFTLYVLYKTRIKKSLFYLFNDEYVFFCFAFAIIFAGFVGVSTLNFGTLARYRIPVIPFYLFSMLLILHKTNTVEKVKK